MKKYIQNILAQNSSGEIMYICGKCGTEVDKEATECPKCHSKLGKIRCPFCNFIGDLKDFKEDTCPRCGRKKKKAESKDNFVYINNNSNLFSKKLFWFLFFLLLSILVSLVFFIIYHYNII